MKDAQTEKVFKIIGASNHSLTDREATDFYSTDPECVADLLERESFGHEILEPCCGSGSVSKALEDAGYDVMSTDLYDHGYGESGIDCFSYKDIDRDVITNPPYGLVTDFTEHMLDNLKPGRKMALFLKLQFLEGQDRYQKIFSKMKLRKVYVYVKRVACYKNGEMYQKSEDGSIKLDRAGNKVKAPSAVCYAWLIFDSDYSGLPELDWIAK